MNSHMQTEKVFQNKFPDTYFPNKPRKNSLIYLYYDVVLGCANFRPSTYNIKLCTYKYVHSLTFEVSTF